MKKVTLLVDGEELDWEADNTLTINIPREPIGYVKISDAAEINEEHLSELRKMDFFEVDIGGREFDARIEGDLILIYDKI